MLNNLNPNPVKSQGSQLTFFKDHLPRVPYATDHLENGIFRIPKIDAIKSRYIQHNGPTHKRFMVFDIDRPGGGIDWENEPVPAPNIVCTNTKNYHSHLIYGLEIPVRVNAPDARIKPIRYAAGIENGLMIKLNADPGYAGLICKNPLSDYWEVNTYQPYLYTLDLLSEYVDFTPYKDLRKHIPEYGLGRNSTLFENLSKWAYRARLKTWDKNFSYWSELVYRKAEYYNATFKEPLPFTEIKATARSISKWVWKHFTEFDFKQIQRQRSLKASKKRNIEARDRQQLVFWYKETNPGAKINEIAKAFNISKRTAQYYLNNQDRLSGRKRTISDNSRGVQSPISDNSRFCG